VHVTNVKLLCDFLLKVIKMRQVGQVAGPVDS